MKHIMGNFGATVPVNFQDDYTYELMHPMVGSGSYIAITKGLNKNGGNLAIGHIWPRTRKMYLHNPKTSHTITKENLNKLYDLADSLKDYTFGTFDDVDVPDFFNESSNSNVGNIASAIMKGDLGREPSYDHSDRNTIVIKTKEE